MSFLGDVLTLNTPSRHDRERAWTQPLPQMHFYRFSLRACHTSHLLLSTEGELKDDFEIILGNDHNERSVVRDKEGHVCVHTIIVIDKNTQLTFLTIFFATG